MKGPPWLAAYRSNVVEVQSRAQRAAMDVARGASVVRLAGHRRALAGLIAKHHDRGDAAIRAARFAVDAIDALTQTEREGTT